MEDTKNKSLKETFDELIKELTTNKSKPDIDKIFVFIKENRNAIYNNKIIPFESSMKLLKFFSNNSLFPNIVVDIYKIYIDEFFNIKNYPDEELDKIIKIIEAIFTIQTIFFTQTSAIDFNLFLKKYFDKYYPKDKNIKHKVGDIVDIVVSDFVSGKGLFGWTQMPIKEINEKDKKYKFESPQKNGVTLELKFDDFQFQEKNTFVTEEEVNWKKNLKINDKVDFYNYRKDIWVEGYVKDIDEKGQYIIQPIGEPENALKNIPFAKFSPFIKPLLTYSFKYNPEDISCFTKVMGIEKIHPFRFFLPVTQNCYTVPSEELKNYSLEYYDIVNYFLIKLLSSNVLMDESISIMYAFIILQLINYFKTCVNMRFISKYIYENCFEPIKNVFYKFSESKKKPVNISEGWKYIIKYGMSFFDIILAHNDLQFNLFNYMPEFYITFGFNCLKYGANFEKKHLGLEQIHAMFPFFKMFYDLINKTSRNKMTTFIHNKLFNIKEDIITLLYSQSNIHEELLSKGNEIIENFTNLKILTDKHIEHLYNVAITTPENSDANKYIYTLLNKIITKFSFEQKEIIFNHIISLPYDKIRKYDIELVKNILQGISSKESYLLMTKSFLDYYYKYITEFKNYETMYDKDFGDILSYTKDPENVMILFTLYFRKTLDDLIKQNNLEKFRYYFTIMHSIIFSLIDSYQNNPEQIKLINELKKIFYEKYADFGIIVDKLLELYNLDKNEKNGDFIIDVYDIVKGFIKLIGDDKYLTMDSILKLADFFMFSGKSKKNRKNFMYSIINMKKDESSSNELYDKLFEKMDKYLDILTQDNSADYLDNEFFYVILNLYKNINNKNIDIKDKTDLEIFLIEKEKYLKKNNPLKNKYFDVIWKMYYKSNNIEKINDFLEDFSLKNFTPTERYEIWDKLVKKIMNDIESNNLVGLTMLKYIIKISEKYGNAKVSSHICDLYSNEYTKEMELIFNSSTKEFINLKSFEEKGKNVKINLYVSSTIYDIKTFIEEMIGYDPIIQSIYTKDNKEIKDDSLPLYKVFPSLINSDNYEVKVDLKRNRNLSKIPEYPLLTEDKSELSDKFIELIFNLFYKYAEDEKLNTINFAKFIKDVYEPLNKNKYEMEQIYLEKFKTYSNNKGYLTVDDFLLYFANLAQNETHLTYHFLESLGYTKSLDNYLEGIDADPDNILYYVKNNKKEYMPRYFIGNNSEYMKKIFNVLKNDNNNNIYDLAKEILYEISTPEKFKDILINKDDKNKLEEILYDNNLELKVYLYDIIIIIFNDTKNYDRALVNNFINDNLDKIINEFTKINNNEKNKDPINLFNKKQYIRYFSSVMKLLFHCFKNIIEQKELNEYIDKFVENIELDFKKLIIVLGEEKKNFIKKLNLSNLLDTILNNLLLLTEIKTTEEINTVDSTKLMIYIFLLISNYYEENEKIEIYKKFFENQINILFNCQSYKISSNIFTMTKLLFPLINEEKNEIFIKLENEEILKQMKDYKKLNTIEGDVYNLFDLFIYLYSIYKNINNDELYELFENLMSIILDDKIKIEKIIIEGYLEVINKILNILKVNKYEKIYEYNFDNFIQKLVSEHLVESGKDKKNIINDLKNYDENYFIIYNFYDILETIIEKNPEKYIPMFFENEKIKNLREKYLTKLEEDKVNYSPNEEIRNTYVGLYNPAALCYINSVIQQFFMIPLFQNTILSLPLDPNLNPDLDNDNFVFQLQKMFYTLKYSLKKYYNPKPFVLSFKDSQGKSPDLNEQCDAQEFLLRFIEKLSETLKNTENKYLCENIFGGNTLQQLKCTNPECNNISERRDNINYLTLEIKNKHNLIECLDGFISEEKIEDYHCEKCDKKVTHIKQVLIDQIPNILIIHFQRFVFNYDFFTMDKLNTGIPFEDILNIKQYTVDKDNNDIPLDYFDYELKGALIHSGEQQYGHYYSLVYNKEKNTFYEFNDMSIKEIDYDEGMTLAIGTFGNFHNAYMLIYEKKIKKPIIINYKKLDENMIKTLEENNNKDKIENINGKTYYLFNDDKDVIKRNFNSNDNLKNIIIKNDKSEAELIKYEDALNLIIKENNNAFETQPFINKIFIENIKLKNDYNFYSYKFTSFINKISEKIKQEIINDKTKQKIMTYIPTLKLLNDFTINIISISKDKEHLQKIVNNLIDIYRISKNDELLSYLIKYIDQIKDNIFKNYLISKDRIKGRQIGNYIAKTICIAINNNIEIDLVNKIIQYYTDKIPVEITKKWLDMESFNVFIYHLIENSDLIKRNFIKKNMISRLIDYILGKNSPLYKNDERSEFVNTKGYFDPIIKGIALLYKYYENNISDEEMILSTDDITLINYNKFYDKIIQDKYDQTSTNLLLDSKISLILALSIKENKPINDEDILDYLINQRIEKVKTREEIISYLEILINILKKFSCLYSNKDNDFFNEKLNILLGLPIPAITSGNAEIKFISGKYYDKSTILTNVSKKQNINKDMITLLNLLYDLLNINDLVFNYIDNLPAPNSLKYSYAEYLLLLFLSNKDELEKIEHDEISLNKLSSSYNYIIKKYNKNNLDNISINDKLYFSDASYELKSSENIKLYELAIIYETLKESKKTNLECFNKTTFFSNLDNKEGQEKQKEKEEGKVKEDQIQNKIKCLLVFCHDDLDISIEFKQLFNSKLEINGKKNNHYIFYCVSGEKVIDYSNLKIETKENKQFSQQEQQNVNQNLPQGMRYKLKLPDGYAFRVSCELCGTVNYLNNQTTEFKCSFCECPLVSVKYQ